MSNRPHFHLYSQLYKSSSSLGNVVKCCPTVSEKNLSSFRFNLGILVSQRVFIYIHQAVRTKSSNYFEE